MANIREIHNFLNRLTPHEKYYKKCFEKTGGNISSKELAEYWRKNPPPEKRPAELSILDPAYNNHAETMMLASFASSGVQSNNIQNNVFINQWEGISIRKHSNYFPQFCHSHSYMELCLVLKGRCDHRFYPDPRETSLFETVPLCEHELLIIPPARYHTIHAEEGAVIMNILVKRGVIEKTLSQYLTEDAPLFSYFADVLYGNKRNPFLLFHTRGDAFLKELIDRLLLEYCNRKPLYPQIMVQILGLYLSIVQQNYGGDITVSVNAPAGADYTPKFLLYIQANYAHFSMEKMAEHFHLSQSYISRVFRANTGNTIIRTVMAVRLETARAMLITSGHTVDSIAEYVGYEDTTYFIRIFRAKYGKTPQMYRNSPAAKQ